MGVRISHYLVRGDNFEHLNMLEFGEDGRCIGTLARSERQRDGTWLTELNESESVVSPDIVEAERLLWRIAGVSEAELAKDGIVIGEWEED